MSPVIPNEVSESVVVTEIELCEFVDLFWDLPLFYFKDHNTQLETLCIGNSKDISDINSQKYLKYPKVVIMPFSNEMNSVSVWKNLNSVSYIPELKIERQKDNSSIKLFFYNLDKQQQLDYLNRIKTIKLNKNSGKLGHNKLSEISYYPNYSEWERQVSSVKKAIADKHVEKVVLSRQCSCKCEEEISKSEVLKKMLATNSSGYSFFVNDTNGLFMGCTPELLYKRDGTKLTSMAIAGTQKKSERKPEDLLNDSKEVIEHDFVKKWIENKLKELCNHVTSDTNNSVVEHHNVQHIFAQITGDIQPGISEQSIIDALHPTPAIAGKPRKSSLSYIQNLESYTRGYYSGVLGLVEKDKSVLSVAIRSALIQNDVIHLFSGAGIVNASDAEKEWQELDLKIQYLKDIVFD